MKRCDIKLALRSLLFHLIYTAIAWLFFTIFMSGIRNQMMVDKLFKELNLAMFGFSLVIFLIFRLILAMTHFKSAPEKRAYLAASEGGLTREITAGLRKKNLWESLLITLSALILQLPIAIFFTSFGYGYAQAVAFEKFFVGWISFYLPWGNALLGMVINLSCVFLFSYVGRVVAQRSWEGNRIRR